MSMLMALSMHGPTPALRRSYDGARAARDRRQKGLVDDADGTSVSKVPMGTEEGGGCLPCLDESLKKLGRNLAWIDRATLACGDSMVCGVQWGTACQMCVWVAGSGVGEAGCFPGRQASKRFFPSAHTSLGLDIWKHPKTTHF